MAQKITGQLPGGTKTPLEELVPLDTPLIIQVFPVYACNFTCKYCSFSIPKNKRGFISEKSFLDLDIYKKCINDAADFSQKIKVIRFVGMGEPLLHKDLCEMIKYTSSKHIAERIELITNGFLLKEELSLKLIDSGLTKILISIQGTSAKKYKEISNVTIDFDKFIENIRFLFNNRRDTKIHIKIADIALDGDEEKFYNIFNNVCDTIAVENIGPIHEGVSINKELISKENQYGLINNKKSNICSLPFHFIQINPDGNIVPCYSITYPIILGNCNNENLIKIWNSKKFNDFRLKMLDGMDKIEVCKQCNIFRYRADAADCLDSASKKLKDFYGK